MLFSELIVATPSSPPHSHCPPYVCISMFLSGLDEEQRSCIVDAMFERRVAAGEVVIRWVGGWRVWEEVLVDGWGAEGCCVASCAIYFLPTIKPLM